MSPSLTRRKFMGDTALATVASQLKLGATTLHKAAETQAPERRMRFDAGWKFSLGDVSGASRAAFDDRSWRMLDLPHDWSIEGAFSEDAPAKGNGAYLPTGIGWYRKSFVLPPAARGKRVVIEFDGVYQRSEVWINGVSLGMRPYGFISFAYDLTAHLASAGGTNHLAVRVDNSLQTNCRWYSGSGIYRHTWLRVTDPLHIAQWGIQVQTPAITREAAKVEASTRVVNESDRSATFDLKTEVLNPRGEVVQHSSTSHTLPSGGSEAFAHTLNVVTPQLWSQTTPHLYGLRATVRSREVIVDSETASFGIREAVFENDRGFLLNGQQVKLNGVCLHGDGGSVGTAVPEGVWERRLGLLREMGCNSIRLSHNPPAPELLDMLDRMGFLVMEEAFDEWRVPKMQTPVHGYHQYFDEWSQRDLTAMIERDRNHPSIVIWSAGNEVPDQVDAAGPATLQRLKDIIHRSDSTRPITVACDNIAAEPKSTPLEFLEKLDVVGYNYVDRWRDRREKYYSLDRQTYPNRRFIGTESSAPYGARGASAADQSDDLFFERTSNTEIEVEQLQKFIQTYDYVSGDYLWTGIDYLGEARWPNTLAATGTLDTCGFKKNDFYLYKSLWSKEVVLHIFPHWNWTGKEGKVVPVTCYTNCDTVELFLNGESLGVKGFAFPRPGMMTKYGEYPPRARVLQTTADLHLRWDVVYAPGTLTAKGTKSGVIVETMQIRTTGAPSKLVLSADRQQLRRGIGNVTHVTVEVQDADGQLVPTADEAASFSLRGSGRILGVDNGRPDSHEPYKTDRKRTFNGRALVILEATEPAGTIVLSASAIGLDSASIEFKTD